MNPLAAELNSAIEANAPAVVRMLSQLGKELYYPKGILTQSAEAKAKATRYDATIGEARECKRSIGLPAITKHLVGIEADDVLPYAPSAGRMDLRQLWQKEIREKNPSLAETAISLPVVTSGITHGLSTIADMFVNQGDVVLAPDKLWGNYLLVFGTKRGAVFERYPLLDINSGFDIDGFRQVVKANSGMGKLVVLLNFPNNPTGYSITEAEADAIRDALVEVAAGGCDVVVICDDAYFGLFYGDQVLRESIFTRLADAHPALFAIKLDGASKEDFAWGLRVAFVTFGSQGGAGAYEALEKKAAGCIRGTISNSSNLSQELIVRAMSDPDYYSEKAERFALLEKRAMKVIEVLADSRYDQAWQMYPFNAGYFLCLRLNSLHAEEYRVRLLNEYGIGVISTSDTDIRVALSCVDENDLTDLFETMLKCALEMAR